MKMKKNKNLIKTSDIIFEKDFISYILFIKGHTQDAPDIDSNSRSSYLCSMSGKVSFLIEIARTDQRRPCEDRERRP